MKISLKTLSLTLVAFGAIFFLSSCNKDEHTPVKPVRMITALVTYQDFESGVLMQLDDSTSLSPSNLEPGLYDNKTVRALVQYFKETSDIVGEENSVKVFAIDTIRTKPASEDKGELNDSYYGRDKLEIVKDWVTIGEDGYLTLKVRTHRGDRSAIHSVYLVRKGEEDGKYNFELRHDADGDVYGRETDGLIAFDLNELAPSDRSPVTLHLTWDGFHEARSADFKLTFRKQ
jgi:hypothetical protein